MEAEAGRSRGHQEAELDQSLQLARGLCRVGGRQRGGVARAEVGTRMQSEQSEHPGQLVGEIGIGPGEDHAQLH
jgi:hypothetical protein